MFSLSCLPALILRLSALRVGFPCAHELQKVGTVAKVESNNLHPTIIPVFENKLHR